MSVVDDDGDLFGGADGKKNEVEGDIIGELLGSGDEPDEFADACTGDDTQVTVADDKDKNENTQVTDKGEETKVADDNDEGTEVIVKENGEGGLDKQEEAQAAAGACDNDIGNVNINGEENDDGLWDDLLEENQDSHAASSSEGRRTLQGLRTTFCREVPLGPEDSWDFSLQSLVKGFQSKCMWIEGPFYQKFKGECFHEMHNVCCPCEEKKKTSVCRLCGQVFCSNKCFKKVRDQITSAKSSANSSSDLQEQGKSSDADSSADLESEELQETNDLTPTLEEEQRSEATQNSEAMKGNIPPQQQQQQFPRGRKNQNRQLPYNHNHSQSYGQNMNIGMAGMSSGMANPAAAQQAYNVNILNPNLPPQNSRPTQIHNDFQGSQVQSNKRHPLSLVRYPSPTQNQPPVGAVAPNQSLPSPTRTNVGADASTRDGQQQMARQTIGPQSPHFQGAAAFQPIPSDSSSSGTYYSTRSSPVKSDNVNQTTRKDEAPVKIFRNPGQGKDSKLNNLECQNQGQPTYANPSSIYPSYPRNMARPINPPPNIPGPDTGFDPQGGPPPYQRSQEQKYEKRPNENRDVQPHPQSHNQQFRSDSNPKGKPFFERDANDRQHFNNGPGPRPNDKRQYQHGADRTDNFNHNRMHESGFLDQKQERFKGGFPSKNQNAHWSNQNQNHSNNFRQQGDWKNGGNFNSRETPEKVFEKNKTLQAGMQNNSRRNSSSSQSSKGGDMSSKADYSPRPSSLPKNCLLPDIPVGNMMPVAYIDGNHLNDFSVMTSDNRKLFEKGQPLLQGCPKIKMDVREPGNLCLVKCKLGEKDEEWYRGVITQVSQVKNSTRVYLLDVGRTWQVHRNQSQNVCQLPQDMRYKPLAIRMSVNNISYASDEEKQDAKEQFKLSIRDQPLKIQITHEDSAEWYKYAGKMMFMHINEWVDVADYLEGLLICSKRSEKEIEYDKRLVAVQSTSAPPPPPISSLAGPRRQILGKIMNVVTLQEFYVATKESIKKAGQIESQLNKAETVAQFDRRLVKREDLSTGFFAVFNVASKKWTRVTAVGVSERDPSSVVLFGLDTGVVGEVPIQDLRILPEDLRSPSTVYGCSLPLKHERRFQEKADNELRERVGKKVNIVPLTEVGKSHETTLVELFFDDHAEFGLTSYFLKQGFQLSENVDLSRPK